jgi:hypothetical protein
MRRIVNSLEISDGFEALQFRHNFRDSWIHCCHPFVLFGNLQRSNQSRSKETSRIFVLDVDGQLIPLKLFCEQSRLQIFSPCITFFVSVDNPCRGVDTGNER